MDKCGVYTVNIFHLYGGFKRRWTRLGNFIKVSCRSISKKNSTDKKLKLRAFVVYTKYNIKKSDGSRLKFKFNSCVLLKKRLTPKGKELFGPCVFELNRKKFMSTFVNCI